MQPLAFVDLETTGATVTTDRITEIGIVAVDAAGVREWSTLVNPETPIPAFIQAMTGITDAMVANAPTFAAIAGEVLERLAGRVFIAHNARFDYGFLKNEFKRAGHDFRADVLCTVKLSRKLYPAHKKHGLDALIERHGLAVDGRHRALAAARRRPAAVRSRHLSHPRQGGGQDAAAARFIGRGCPSAALQPAFVPPALRLRPGFSAVPNSWRSRDISARRAATRKLTLDSATVPSASGAPAGTPRHRGDQVRVELAVAAVALDLVLEIGGNLEQLVELRVEVAQDVIGEVRQSPNSRAASAP